MGGWRDKPPQRIVVECPECGERYEAWFRASMNLDLEDFSEDDMREASTATCRSCGHVVELGSLIVEDGVWRWGAERGRAARLRRGSAVK
jgi:predicted RNA-binding Zn-ribbon protein involved in translation (DUF1610 family)